MSDRYSGSNPYTPGATSTAGKGGSFRQLVNRRNDTSRAESIVDVPPDVAWSVLSDVLVSGRGILLSPTSDGGAISVTLYDGDDRLRTYCSDQGELREALDALRAHITASAATSPTAPPRSRK